MKAKGAQLIVSGHWGWVSISSNNNFVSTTNKPLFEAMLTKFRDSILRYYQQWVNGGLWIEAMIYKFGIQMGYGVEDNLIKYVLFPVSTKSV